VHKNARLHYLSDRVRQGVKLKYQTDNYWNAAKMVPLWQLYVSTMKGAVEKRQSFDDLSYYCMFIGHERSGHSLVGAILDAHPEIIISHEQNTVPLFAMGFTAGQVFSLLLDASRQQAEVGRGESGYNYVVPEQWQGRYSKLRVIGDKDARRDTATLTRYPEMFQVLQKKLPVPLRVVHVVRNPYDNVATIRTRNEIDFPLEHVMNRYINECETIQNISQRFADAVIVTKHEDFVADPRREITRLCAFLGVEVPQDYLDACAAIVRPSTHKSRKKVDWTDAQRRRIDDAIARFDFLAGYSYES
jgi:hypothetical protein